MDVGFVGLGNMGGPMAANLARAGHRLRVFDLREEACAPLLELGAEQAASAAETVEGAEAVLLSLPMPRDVEEVVTGSGGVLAAAGSGAVIVDLSTNSPIVVRGLADKARGKGVGFVDAPVSGGVRGARDATLAVMVGGEVDDVDRVRPLLESIGANVFHVGPVGTGNVAKLVNNQLAFVSMMAMNEALVLGAKAGLDPVVLRDVVRAGSGNSFPWDGGARAVLRDRLAPTFTVTLATKDIGLAQDLAVELGVDSPMGQAARQLLDHYREHGFAGEDVLATVKAVEQQGGAVVRGTWHD